MAAIPQCVRSPADRDDDDDDRHRLVTRPDSTADVEIDDSDGQPEITVPISSTTEHRSGSRMTEPALESMAGQLEDGIVGLWDDHGLDEMGWPEYRREDMYGWWVDGHVEDGVLMGTARLLADDPRTESLLNQLEQGAPVGFSVGYFALRDEWVEREDSEIREILEVDLVETSAVGIPDNPDAYADGAELLAHSLAERGVNPQSLDNEAVDQIAAGVADAFRTMTEGDTEAGDNPADETDEQHDDEPPEQRQFSEDEVAEIQEAVAEAMEDHMPRILEDVGEMLLEEDEAANDGEDEEDEEEAAGDHEDDEDDDEASQASAAVAELRSELDELRSENEELQAKVDRLESETRESEGRKGFSTGGADPDAGDDQPDGGADADAGESTNSSDNDPRNTLDEAQRLAGGH